MFIVPSISIKYINNNTISIKIWVNFESWDFIKKNDILSVNIEAVRVIDNFGFSYYMEFFGEYLI